MSALRGRSRNFGKGGHTPSCEGAQNINIRVPKKRFLGIWAQNLRSHSWTIFLGGPKRAGGGVHSPDPGPPPPAGSTPAISWVLYVLYNKLIDVMLGLTLGSFYHEPDPPAPTGQKGCQEADDGHGGYRGGEYLSWGRTLTRLCAIRKKLIHIVKL